LDRQELDPDIALRVTSIGVTKINSGPDLTQVVGER